MTTKETFLEGVDASTMKKIVDTGCLGTRIFEAALKLYRLAYPESSQTPRYTHIYYTNKKRDDVWVAAQVHFGLVPRFPNSIYFRVDLEVLKTEWAGSAEPPMERRTAYWARAEWEDDRGLPQSSITPCGKALIRL
jgi:hypothetical protein